MGRRAIYRLRCETEDKWVYTEYTSDIPTTCPNDDGHTIIAESLTISDLESLKIEDFIDETELNYIVDDVEEQTTSKDYIEKATLTLTGLPSSKYRIAFYAEISQSDNKGGVEVQCTVNGEEIAQMGMEPEDIKVDYETFSGFTISTLSGDIDVKINWRKSNHDKKGSAKIRRARIEITKAI